jgi:hypothetical protein
MKGVHSLWSEWIKDKSDVHLPRSPKTKDKGSDLLLLRFVFYFVSIVCSLLVFLIAFLGVL